MTCVFKKTNGVAGVNRISRIDCIGCVNEIRIQGVARDFRFSLICRK